MSKNSTQNHDERRKESGQKTEQTNSPVKVNNINSGSNTYAAFEAGMHLNSPIAEGYIYEKRNEVEGYIFEKGPSGETANCSKPSYSLKKSVHVLEKLQDNEVAKEQLLELQKPQNILSQIGNNSMQPQETKRLKTELKTLKELRDELLNENNALRNMQNDFANELRSLRQQVEEQALKNYDLANFMEFSYLELEKATNNFDGKLKIGEGGYGSVYQGVLHCTTVAIKILRTGGTQGKREFYQEVYTFFPFFFLLVFYIFICHT
jgi:hypothetical protein